MDSTVELKMAELLVGLLSVASVGFCWGMLAVLWPRKSKEQRSGGKI